MVDTKSIDKKRTTSRVNAKGSLPPEVETSLNLGKPESGKKVPLQLSLSAELRREFKGYANDHDTSASNLFETVWEYYKQTHG